MNENLRDTLLSFFHGMEELIYSHTYRFASEKEKNIVVSRTITMGIPGKLGRIGFIGELTESVADGPILLLSKTGRVVVGLLDDFNYPGGLKEVIGKLTLDPSNIFELAWDSLEEIQFRLLPENEITQIIVLNEPGWTDEHLELKLKMMGAALSEEAIVLRLP